MTSSEDEGDLEEAGGAGIARSNSMSQNPSGQPSGFGDPNKVILSGYLMKQGKRKNWRKRWFVLMSGRLVYSRSHMVRFALTHLFVIAPTLTCAL